jgi:hypothetical protein
MLVLLQFTGWSLALVCLNLSQRRIASSALPNMLYSEVYATVSQILQWMGWYWCLVTGRTCSGVPCNWSYGYNTALSLGRFTPVIFN